VKKNQQRQHQTFRTGQGVRGGCKRVMVNIQLFGGPVLGGKGTNKTAHKNGRIVAHGKGREKARETEITT